MTGSDPAARPAEAAASAGHVKFALPALHLILLAATITPVLAVEIPPMGDYLNHLARFHILANLDTTPSLRENYEVIPTFTPYLLVDWMLAPLAGVWSVYDVGRAFVAATMALTYGGLLALSRAFFPRPSLWPALALPILYNHALSWGFMNYNFGVAVMFWALALWFHLGQRNAWLRFAVLTGLSASLYLTHLLAFGVFAVIVGGHSLSAAYHRHGARAAAILRELALVIPPFVLTLAVYVFWLASGDVDGEKITEYGDITRKPAAIVSPTMFADSIADGALLMVYLIGGLYLVRRARLRLAAGMGLPLILFTVVCLVMPNTLLGVWGVDFRLPPVLLMLLIATSRPDFVAARPLPPAAVLAITGLVAFRVVTLWPPMQAADRQYLEFRDAVAEIAEGARVLVSGDDVPGRLAMPERAYLNLALIAVIERGAFVPDLFTGVTQVRPTERNRPFDAGAGPVLRTKDIVMGLEPGFIADYRNRSFDAFSRVYWADWPKNFDYLVRINPAPMDAQIGSHLDSVSRYSFFEIGQVRR